VSVITSVSKDHMEILGDDIRQIAAEKAGIIKPHVPVVYWGENEEVADVIEKTAIKCGTKAICVKKDCIKIETKTNNSIDFYLVNSYDKYGCLTIPFAMEYQTWNVALVLRALEEILPNTEESVVREGLMATKWPGRMEKIADRVYIDGAHNYDGVLQFKEYVNELMKKESTSAYILFSVVKEKEYYQMMDLIEQIEGCKGFIVAPVMNARATAVEELKGYLETSGKPVYAFDSLAEAYRYGLQLKGQEEYLFCVGSLYMVGEIMQAHNMEVHV